MFVREFRSMEMFAHFLDGGVPRMFEAFKIAAEMATDVLYDKALDVYGDTSKLASLAPYTQEDRASRNYAANEPLERTGELLKHSLEKHSEFTTAAVGTPEVIHAYHEFGYMNARTGTDVPPRQVFKWALHDSEAEVLEIERSAIEAALGGLPFRRPARVIFDPTIGGIGEL